MVENLCMDYNGTIAPHPSDGWQFWMSAEKTKSASIVLFSPCVGGLRFHDGQCGEASSLLKSCFFSSGQRAALGLIELTLWFVDLHQTISISFCEIDCRNNEDNNLSHLEMLLKYITSSDNWNARIPGKIIGDMERNMLLHRRTFW